LEAAFLSLALVISGATGSNSDCVNGNFVFQGIKDDMPFYKNLINQSYCYRASDGKWYVSDEADLEAGEAAGFCASLEAGLGHPSRASRWQVALGHNKWEEQPAVIVAMMVILFE